MSATSSFNQRTLQEPISCEGVGLHSGLPVMLRLIPAPTDHGIVFVRTDLSPSVSIPALSEFVVDTSLATTLGKDGVRVGTVEHLLSALSGLGIDNLRIELNGPEIPIMDGSAAPFAYLIKTAGIRIQDEPKSFIVIKKPVSVVVGDKEASFSPMTCGISTSALRVSGGKSGPKAFGNWNATIGRPTPSPTAL